MRKKLLYLATLAMSAMSFGQIFYEDFDQGNFPQSGWTLQNSGDLNWDLQVMNGGGFNENIVYVHGSFWEDQDEWLISPSIDLSTADAPYLTFNTLLFYVAPENPSEFNVKITTNGTDWTEVWNWGMADIPNDWEGRIYAINIDLSAYEGQSNVKIAFNYKTPKQIGLGAYFDKVQIFDNSLYAGCENTITSFPFTETFEDDSASRYCWKNEYVNNVSDWNFRTGTGDEGMGEWVFTAHNGQLNAAFGGLEPQGSITKLVSPKMDLTSLTYPELSFWHVNASGMYGNEKMEIYYKTSENGVWKAIPGAVYTMFNTPDWKEAKVYLPEPSSEYYIAFHGTKQNGLGFGLDDVTVQEGSYCSPSTPSNNFQNGADVESKYVANDFFVSSGTTYKASQLILNLISSTPTEEITLTFYTDDNGKPGGQITQFESITPVLREVIGTWNSHSVEKMTVEFPQALSFDGGEEGATYWVSAFVNSTDENAVYAWETTSVINTEYSGFTSTDGTTWQAVENNVDGVFEFVGNCSETPDPYDGCAPFTPSNDFENGHGYLNDFIAHDFQVNANSNLVFDEIVFNAMTENSTLGVSLFFHEDNNGLPGDVVAEYIDLEPHKVLIGAKGGYFVEETTVNLPSQLSLSGGENGKTYWLAISIYGPTTFWESTSILNSENTGKWSANGIDWSDFDSEGDWDGVFKIVGECTELSTSDLDKFDFTYYPNPVKDYLTIQTNLKIQNVEIFNLAGQSIASKIKVLSGKIDTQNLSAGVYVFKVMLDGGKVETFKILKK
ncbi:T9SS type A sorting domain-containing protein [Moheibacter sediminis]|uniref:Por secretion system C-terminal sorting domain-containing protein n=1 Tax=Moheibacter sediminis TaxID=1434700 RepID=A0A1W1YDZ1_9FLAO|nr:T9SS type A sorting domain-containing protein [Moheibacter sediminis]SMC34440.1 Por secretion system C-terminal sorting domain-containing protein [Moheibacter sediminis]